MQWLAEIQDAMARFFAIFKIDLPEILTLTWTFFSDEVWPILIDVVAQPLFWRAVRRAGLRVQSALPGGVVAKGSAVRGAFLARPPSRVIARS